MNEVRLSDGAAPAPGLEELRSQPASAPAVRRDIAQFHDVPMELTIELTTVDISIRELLELAPGSLLDLPAAGCEGVNIKVGETRIARGEIASQDNRYGVRLLEIIDVNEQHGGSS